MTSIPFYFFSSMPQGRPDNRIVAFTEIPLALEKHPPGSSRRRSAGGTAARHAQLVRYQAQYRTTARRTPISPAWKPALSPRSRWRTRTAGEHCRWNQGPVMTGRAFGQRLDHVSATAAESLVAGQMIGQAEPGDGLRSPGMQRRFEAGRIIHHAKIEVQLVIEPLVPIGDGRATVAAEQAFRVSGRLPDRGCFTHGLHGIRAKADEHRYGCANGLAAIRAMAIRHLDRTCRNDETTASAMAVSAEGRFRLLFFHGWFPGFGKNRMQFVSIHSLPRLPQCLGQGKANQCPSNNKNLNDTKKSSISRAPGHGYVAPLDVHRRLSFS